MTSNSLLSLFSLNVSSGIPIYRQLIDQIKQAIRMDLIQSGEQLPSVRNLALALQVNPMTISKAFAQLEIEGVLIRKRGIGMLVAETDTGTGASISKVLEAPLNKFITKARNENLTDDEIFTLVQQYLSINKENIK